MTRSQSIMSRDHRKLRVFILADRLVLEVYRASLNFPASERYGLQSQLRKGAVSSAVNIVEGSARRTDGEYLYFLNIALGSAAETRYLCDLSARLNYLAPADRQNLEAGYAHLCAALTALINSLEPLVSRRKAQPRAQSPAESPEPKA
jgi:four helix bundle protein